MSASALDNAIASPATYGDEAKLHALLAQLRKEDPVHWTAPDNFRPYWALTKYADILEIEKLNDQFHNEPRSVLMDKKAESDLARCGAGPIRRPGACRRSAP
jgi:hypothetical protein